MSRLVGKNMSRELIPVEALDPGHSLRVEFSVDIIRTLSQQGRSINVVGGKGTGKSRLLEDIEKCRLPGIHMVSLNLEDHTADYDGLLLDIHSQLHGTCEKKISKEHVIKSNTEEDTSIRFQRIVDLFISEEKSSPLHLVLVDNFDALSQGTTIDPRFDTLFLAHLNLLATKGNILFLITSRKPYDTLLALMNKDNISEKTLNPEIIAIPELTRSQILHELERQLDEFGVLWLKTNPNDKEILLEAIGQHPCCYAMLGFCATKINNRTYEEEITDFSKRLMLWQKEFDLEMGISAPGKTASLRGILKGIIDFFK